MSHSQSQIAIDPALSFGLNFDSRDLFANQQGRMTSRQVRLLRDKRRNQSTSPSILGRIVGGMFYMIYGVSPQRHQWNQIGADITATMTHHQHGQVTLPQSISKKEKSIPHASYQITINHQSYKVDRRALRSFRHHETYTVYYAPHSKHALSAEVN